MDHLRLRPADAVEIDGVVRELVAKGRQPERAVEVDVRLADLEEAPERSQDRQALRDEGTGERVEDEIHSGAVGASEYLRGEVEGARVHHVRHPERREVRTLLGAPRGGEDGRTELLRELH